MPKIDELKFDDKNFNAHTEFGMSLLEKSLHEFGAGRSVLVDKNNNIIAGNGIVEAAAQAGIEDIEFVETTGEKLVVVKRTDVDLNTQKGREMAFADNATAAADLEWDEELVRDEAEKWGIVLGDWGVNLTWDEDINDIIDKASEGSVQDYSDDVDYNLEKLFREKLNNELMNKIKNCKLGKGYLQNS